MDNSSEGSFQAKDNSGDFIVLNKDKKPSKKKKLVIIVILSVVVVAIIATVVIILLFSGNSQDDQVSTNIPEEYKASIYGDYGDDVSNSEAAEDVLNGYKNADEEELKSDKFKELGKKIKSYAKFAKDNFGDNTYEGVMSIVNLANYYYLAGEDNLAEKTLNDAINSATNDTAKAYFLETFYNHAYKTDNLEDEKNFIRRILELPEELELFEAEDWRIVRGVYQERLNELEGGLND